MANLQIGTFVLNIELLIYFIAGIAGVLIVRYRDRNHAERERRAGQAWNAVFLWIIVWKASLMLFDFQGVIRHPLSLVFFSGGLRGVWLASIISLAYLFLRNYRPNGSREALKVAGTWGAGMAAVSFFALILLDDSSGTVHYVGFAMAVVLLAILLQSTSKIASQSLGILLLVAMLGFTIFDGTVGQSARVDQAAPDFELRDLDGNTVRLSDYRGKTVVLNFWATWCRVCQAEMPHLEKFYRDQQDRNVVLLSVNATSQERSDELVGKYANQEGLSFPIVLDESGEVLRDYAVTAYPTTYIIDPSGTLRNQYLGATSYETLMKAARPIR
ncbi:hypothetical protein DMN77_10520 [Paenibacillus sp. 79R4]|uniref:TlpA disulfide reductase family protein n=1 Tax=Paenibacillus sp. 79R4 TaxID=2212847 RepID=UPI0015BCB449|nr:TlpA disulfide reductase family protein [Paenibacillus sp. 79R4]NWL88022.1 hypothetical protein [Paenibacillus sp. 79R4]